MTFQRLDVSFFPQPHLVIHQCRFLIPETASGTLTSLTVYPEILSLFLGKFRNAKIHVDTPDIAIHIGKRREIKENDLDAFSSKRFKEKVGSALSLVSSKAPGLVVLVENGPQRGTHHFSLLPSIVTIFMLERSVLSAIL